MIAPNHCHDFDAKALVLGGEITITRDNTPITFRAGQCFEVPAGCMHAEHVGPEEGALLFITVDGAWDINWVGGPPKPEDFTSKAARQAP